MNIIAHRGMWDSPNATDQLPDLIKALNAGHGIETDLRDHQGEIVIAHDPVQKNDSPSSLRVLLQYYRESKCSSVLALNIKSEGLGPQLKDLLQEFQIQNYFVFDMSIPETLKLYHMGLKIFIRASEYENPLLLLPFAEGLWIDQLQHDWITPPLIETFLRQKKICFVSPELHRRDHQGLWQILKDNPSPAIFLCTDYPDQAKKFYGLN